jgi:endoglucanase
MNLSRFLTIQHYIITKFKTRDRTVLVKRLKSGASMALKKVLFIAFILIVSMSSFALSPVGTHGKLNISDGKMVGSVDSQPVQLAGMSLFWSLWEGEKFYNRQVVSWLVQNWNVSVVRACLGIGQAGSYDTDPNAAQNQYNKIKAVVDAAIANGIYVIVDYHGHDANLSVDKAKKFFSDMSKEYAGVPNLIWEIWNEPDVKNGSGIVYSDPALTEARKTWDNWRDIKKYAAEVIPVIRANSDNIIVVGTPDWSKDVDTAIADPIAGPNIAYTLHFYAGQPYHQDTLRAKARAAVAKKAPLFVTEFGTTKSDGGSDGTYDSVQTRIWLDWCDSNKISWVNWSIVDKGEASAVLKSGAPATGGWTNDQISPSGKLILARLKSRPAYEYTDIIPDDGKSLPGVIEAESYAAKSDAIKSENTSDASGGQSLGYTSNGAWTEYNVVVRKEGAYQARLRVATDPGGTLTLKSGTTTLAIWKVASTGGWSSWKTTDNSGTFSLPAGEKKLRLEWSGTASSLVNLNYLEFVFIKGKDPNDTIPNDSIPNDTIPNDTISNKGKSLPGRIEAESLKSKSEALTIENCSDTSGRSGGKSLGYTTNGAWAEYPVTIVTTGKYTAKIRVAADQGFGGTITMKIGDKKVNSWTIGSTGGWSTWKTIDSCDTFELTKGDAVLRLEWSGTASSLVNINWMEFTCHTAIGIREFRSPMKFKAPVLSINKGTLSLTHYGDVIKISLLSLDGRVIKSIVPMSSRVSLPVGNGAFLIVLQSRNGMMQSYRVVNSD